MDRNAKVELVEALRGSLRGFGEASRVANSGRTCANYRLPPEVCPAFVQGKHTSVRCRNSWPKADQWRYASKKSLSPLATTTSIACTQGPDT